MGVDTMSLLRDLSLILLAVIAFALALVPVVLLGGLAYGLWRLQRHENLPTWLGVAHSYLKLVLAYVELAMATAVRPIVIVYSIQSRVAGWLRALAKLGGSR
jgi:hypothetical protein